MSVSLSYEKEEEKSEKDYRKDRLGSFSLFFSVIFPFCSVVTPLLCEVFMFVRKLLTNTKEIYGNIMIFSPYFLSSFRERFHFQEKTRS